jgi:phosphatidylserine/phosphatidylglycerophosphate/cardiolipin synthase-like enzyme
MAAAGIQAHQFNTTKGRANRFQINFRNHRKIVVVDGQEAWVGGHNVGDEYLGQDPKSGPWRDTHIRVCGPVVQAVQLTFAEDWHWASGAMLDLEWIPTPCSSGKSVAALALPSGPADILETCTLFFIKAIQSAEHRLWIASPYFVPDEQFITALQLAVLKGVDVRLLIPRKTDNQLVTLTQKQGRLRRRVLPAGPQRASPRYPKTRRQNHPQLRPGRPARPSRAGAVVPFHRRVCNLIVVPILTAKSKTNLHPVQQLGFPKA